MPSFYKSTIVVNGIKVVINGRKVYVNGREVPQELLSPMNSASNVFALNDMVYIDGNEISFNGKKVFVNGQDMEAYRREKESETRTLSPKEKAKKRQLIKIIGETLNLNKHLLKRCDTKTLELVYKLQDILKLDPAIRMFNFHSNRFATLTDRYKRNIAWCVLGSTNAGLGIATGVMSFMNPTLIPATLLFLGASAINLITSVPRIAEERKTHKQNLSQLSDYTKQFEDYISELSKLVDEHKDEIDQLLQSGKEVDINMIFHIKENLNLFGSSTRSQPETPVEQLQSAQNEELQERNPLPREDRTKNEGGKKF